MDLTDRQHSVAVLGGDARQVYAADHLTRAGYAVKTYGLAADTQRAIRCASFEAAINEADIWLLPLPMTRDGFQITGTDISVTQLVSRMSEKHTVFCGRPDTECLQKMSSRGSKVIDYSQDEVFMIRNAQPTAEGAVGIAMNEMRRTLFGSCALVVGYGRIGKLLSELLIRVGVDVTVAARKDADLAYAALRGCHTCKIITREKGSELPALSSGFHVIFNTVPVLLLDERMLEATDRETVLIDLASAPGGIDYDATNRLGLKTVVALSLPGKVAPLTAGEIIGDCVLSYMRGGDGSP